MNYELAIGYLEVAEMLLDAPFKRKSTVVIISNALLLSTMYSLRSVLEMNNIEVTDGSIYTCWTMLQGIFEVPPRVLSTVKVLERIRSTGEGASIRGLIDSFNAIRELVNTVGEINCEN